MGSTPTGSTATARPRRAPTPPRAEWWSEDYPVSPSVGYAQGSADEDPIAVLALPRGGEHLVMPLRRPIGFIR